MLIGTYQKYLRRSGISGSVYTTCLCLPSSCFLRRNMIHGTSGFSSFPDLWNISIVCYIALLRNFVIFDWMLFNVALVTIYTRIIVVFIAPANLLCRAGDAYLEFDGTSG